MDVFAHIAREKVRHYADKVLASPYFCNSPRQQRFLDYLISHSLNDETGQLKGYTIGIEVFDKEIDFDPSVDSIVLNGFFVVATTVVFQAQAKQGTRVGFIQFDRPLVELDDLVRIIPERGYGCSPLVKVLGRLFDGSEHVVEDLHASGDVVAVPQTLGNGEVGLILVVTAHFGGFVAFNRPLKIVQGKIRTSLVVIGEGPAIGILEGRNGLFVTAHQVLANAEPH